MKKYIIYSAITSLILLTFTACNAEDGEKSPLTLDDPPLTCSTVMAYAINPTTQKCQEFTSPCNVPSGWVLCEIIPSVDSAPVIVKKTEQIKSYGETGFEVTDSSIKDDGYYQKGESARYTRASDIVTDELTELMWQDDVNSRYIQKGWLTSDKYEDCNNNISSACSDTSGDTASTYCSELSFGGYSDWRVPKLDELANIMNYSKDNLINNNFQNWIGKYWSASTYAEFANYAWFINVDKKGYIGYRTKNYIEYVKCVRESNN